MAQFRDSTGHGYWSKTSKHNVKEGEQPHEELKRTDKWDKVAGPGAGQGIVRETGDDEPETKVEVRPAVKRSKKR